MVMLPVTSSLLKTAEHGESDDPRLCQIGLHLPLLLSSCEPMNISNKPLWDFYCRQVTSKGPWVFQEGKVSSDVLQKKEGQTP